jgi:hypothetical protein
MHEPVAPWKQAAERLPEKQGCKGWFEWPRLNAQFQAHIGDPMEIPAKDILDAFGQFGPFVFGSLFGSVLCGAICFLAFRQNRLAASDMRKALNDAHKQLLEKQRRVDNLHALIDNPDTKRKPK